MQDREDELVTELYGNVANLRRVVSELSKLGLRTNIRLGLTAGGPDGGTIDAPYLNCEVHFHGQSTSSGE